MILIFKIFIYAFIGVNVGYALKLGFDLFKMKRKWGRYNNRQVATREQKEFEKAMINLVLDLSIAKKIVACDSTFHLSGIVRIQTLKDLAHTEIDYKYLKEESKNLDELK